MDLSRERRSKLLVYILIVAFVLLIFLVLTGCGGKEPGNVGGNAPVTGPVTQGEIELEDGKKINFGTGKSGENMELPADFPVDVLPLLDDAQIYHVNTNDSNKAIGITFLSEKSLAEAVAFYQEVMKDGKINMENENEDMYMAMGSKDGYAVTISMTKTPDKKSNILLDVTPLAQ